MWHPLAIQWAAMSKMASEQEARKWALLAPPNHQAVQDLLSSMCQDLNFEKICLTALSQSILFSYLLKQASTPVELTTSGSHPLVTKLDHSTQRSARDESLELGAS